MLVLLRNLWGRWDASDTPRWRRGAFGAVLLAWFTLAAAGIYSLARWDIRPFLYFGGSMLTLAIVQTYRYKKYGPDVSPGASSLIPSQPSDTTHDPWRPPTG